MFNREKAIYLLVIISAIFLLYNGQIVDKKIVEYNTTTKKINRIVSMSPANTEIIFAVGGGDQVVGVTSYCDYPPEALTKEKIGNFYRPDVEKIVSLQPDLVLANGNLQGDTVRQLRSIGIKVLEIKAESLDDVISSLKAVATLVGREQEGKSLITKLNNYRLEAKSKIDQSAAGKKVFIEIWDRPLLTVGGLSHLNDLVKEAGGINVAEHIQQDYTTWDLEKIYTANPDVYLRLRGADMGSRADLLPQNLRELPAVKNNQVVTVFGDWVVRPGPRSFEALPKITEAIYQKGATE